ncbi:hypothetical protein SteCoe_34195 [Stentor coeruleus]|uniref:Cyclic nucleotide-binding domain-containing protein n=1 Tax=Stentor coeruleus TaxID=5963 RepID=A0A1R2AV48_9CILI|nr:hypothetical protein SteCoe_34195 [Stentor coeruleus]
MDKRFISLYDKSDQTFLEDKKLLSSPIRSYKEYWQRAMKKIKLERKLINFRAAQHSHPYAVADELIEYICRQSELSKHFFKPKLPILIIHPHSLGYLIWLIVLTFSLLYIATYGAFNIAFMDYDTISFGSKIEVLIDFIVLADFIVTLNLAYFNNENVLIVERKMIIRNLFRLSNILDLFATIPFGLYIFFALKENAPYIFYLRFFPKLIQLIRVLRKFRSFLFIKKLDTFAILNQKFVYFSKMILLLSLCLHLMSCIFYMAARVDNFSPETWIVRSGLEDLDPWEKYFACVYWAITTLTTIGYGDITPFTITEKAAAMIWMTIGVYIISYSVGQFTSFYFSLCDRDKKISHLLILAEEFSKITNLPSSIKRNIKVSVKNLATVSNTCKIEKILNEISVDLRHEIAINIYKGAIQKFPFFTSKDKVFICFVVFQLEYIEIPNEKIMWGYHEYTEGIYFIIEGRVKFLHKNMLFNVSYEGQYFGDTEVFMKSLRKFSVVTCDYCKMLKINNQCLNRIKENYIEYYIEMKSLVVKRTQNLLMNLAEMIAIMDYRKGDIFFISKNYVTGLYENLCREFFKNNNEQRRKEIFYMLELDLSLTNETLRHSIELLKRVKIVLEHKNK